MEKKRRKRKSLWGRVYAVGYRFQTHENIISTEDVQPFDIIMPTKSHGFADPFPFKYHDKHYIFVEIMDKYTERGSIGVCCIEDGCKITEIIREEFHMSYPNVFEFWGDIYMIPETYQAEQIRLYKCLEFPYKWKLESVLISGLKVVDFSFYMNGEQMYGMAYDIGADEWKNRYLKCDVNNWKMHEIFPERIAMIDKRPGGNFIFDEKNLFIPVQECGKCYGEYLHFISVKEFNEEKIVEEEVFQVKAKDIKTKRKFIYFDRVHTYNKVGNFETVDMFLYQFSLKKIWLVLTGKI